MNNMRDEETTEEINAAENRFMANSARQLSNLRKQYQQPHPLSQLEESAIPQGQYFKVWQQHYHQQQQWPNQYLAPQSSFVAQQGQQDKVSETMETSEEDFDNEDNLSQEFDNSNQSIMSPTGSEVYDIEENDENNSLAGRIIDLMPEYPCLWNVRLRSYKDLNMKEEAWNELEIKLKTLGMHVKVMLNLCLT